MSRADAQPLGDITLIPLGVSAAIPAHGRHLTAHALDLGAEWVLFDCGEGAQYQITKTGLRPSRLSTICITHLHGDHVFGLPGLLTSLSMTGREEPLTIIAPRRLFGPLMAWPGVANTTFEIVPVLILEDLSPAVVLETDAYTIEARPLDHRVFCAGYRWQEKPGQGNLDVEKARALGVVDWRDYRRLKAGESVEASGRIVQPSHVITPPALPRSMAFVTDTAPCEGGRSLCQGASLVVHDSTFATEHAERGNPNRSQHVGAGCTGSARRRCAGAAADALLSALPNDGAVRSRSARGFRRVDGCGGVRACRDCAAGVGSCSSVRRGNAQKRANLSRPPQPDRFASPDSANAVAR